MFSSARCMWMRGGTSKGGFFLVSDLPLDQDERNAFLCSAMGSPDPRQIDGMGGADPLTSKVAIIGKSRRPGVDVDYLFLQIHVDQALVSSTQNCGNMLAGVGPFAIERGLVSARKDTTDVTVFMENTGNIAVLNVRTPDQQVTYEGTAEIDGAPGTSAPISIAFRDIAGSTCGALLPTGNTCDMVNGTPATLIDNGMPCVVLAAREFGVRGDETPTELEGNHVMLTKLEAIRRAAGSMMRLGDVRDKSVPKVTLVSAPRNGGAIATRTFIPHRCHKAIGVFGAVSVASACCLPDGPAADLADVGSGENRALRIEHPTGQMTVLATVQPDGNIAGAAILRTARKLMDGVIFSRGK